MSSRADEIFDFLEGRFLYSATPEGGRSGHKVIFFVFNNIKNMACSVFPMAYLYFVRRLAYFIPNNRAVARFITGYGIPFVIFFTFIQYRTIFTYLPILKNPGVWFIFYLSAMVMSLITFLIVLFTSPATIDNENDKALIHQMVDEDKFLKKILHRCEGCKVYHILRSYHCVVCQHHVCKFHIHSPLFNKCIGAGNQLPYALFFLFNGITIILAAKLSKMERIEGYTSTKFQRISTNFYFVAIFCYGISYLYEFLKQLAFILFNITEHERNQCFKLPYLWGGYNKNFFNPFDKGIKINIQEELNTLLNIDQDAPKKAPEFEESRQRLNDVEDTEKAKKLEDSQRICNWRKQKYLGLYNLYCSPMRKIILDNLKKQKNDDSDDEN